MPFLIKKLIETFQDIKLIKVRSLENFFSKKILFNQKKLLDVGFFQAILVSIPRLILEIFAVLGLSLTIFFFIKLNYSFNEILPFITFLALAIVRMVPAIASLNNNINNVTTNLISFEIVTKHFKDKKISYLKNKDSSDIGTIKQSLLFAGGILGVFNKKPSEWDKQIEISGPELAEIEKLINERKIFKDNKDFSGADAIRDSLLEKGIELIDTENGTTWKSKS